jgi:hypothetical protein
MRTPVSALIGALSAPSPLASSQAPLVIALPIIAVVVLAKVLYSRSRGRPALAGRLVVRCSKGHLFTTIWSPLGSLTSIRLGSARFQRCPLGRHWSLVKPVSESDLTDEERRTAEQNSV